MNRFQTLCRLVAIAALVFTTSAITQLATGTAVGDGLNFALTACGAFVCAGCALATQLPFGAATDRPTLTTTSPQALKARQNSNTFPTDDHLRLTESIDLLFAHFAGDPAGQSVVRSVATNVTERRYAPPSSVATKPTGNAQQRTSRPGPDSVAGGHTN